MKRIILFILFSFALGAPEWHEIKSLPNIKFTPKFKQYSGYLPVSDGNQLFYWLVMAYENPSNAPVFLYLNGGPGCSSLQGLLLEMGPFRVYDYGARVVENPYAWNRFANILFIDSPAGVGFSINSKGNFSFTDSQVAADNHAGLKYFFNNYFPELKNNDFYIGGESYAGYYIPMLAKLLLQDSDFSTFKGYMVGNGCLNDRLLVNSAVGYNYNHAFIDERFYRSTVEKCCDGKSGDSCDWYKLVNLDPSQQCANESSSLYMANYYTGLDPYFLYYSCYLDQPDGTNPLSNMIGENQRSPLEKNIEDNQESLLEDSIPKNQKSSLRKTSIDNMIAHLKRRFNRLDSTDPPLPACSHYDDIVYWLNNDSVKKAIHVPVFIQKYATCSRDVEENYITEIDDVTPYVMYAVNSGKFKRLLFFNGDVDSVCNVVHNIQFVSNLNLTLLQPATPWNFDKDLPSTAGLYTAYQGVDFLTVRGGGHFPASSSQKPREALQMFFNFISGNSNYSTPIPS
ncbi:hypothetical protein FO519_006293 [Halicephalobus sp. NKZ332]|nr:hypothetical protein FO519_006293 [Halicephalobus sp. NKZ332]